MIKFSEFVSLGHPDKIADYISQYLLDRYIEHDPQTRYAVEVQIKGYQVTLGGEVSSKHHFSAQEIRDFVRAAVNEIGYTREYQQKWGADNTICGDLLDVAIYICQQSNDIAQGLSGWGDQGIFFGYCEYRPDTCGMPLDHTLAKRLCKDLFESGIGGLDIKTQVITRNDKVEKVIVAIPLLDDTSKKTVKHFVRSRIKGRYQLIINGTGRYVKHSSIADCGTTGRKLAVDFYGGNSKLGGDGAGESSKPANGSLADRFVIPPFSILDTRKGYWQARKKVWRELIGDMGESRNDTLITSPEIKYKDIYQKTREHRESLGLSFKEYLDKYVPEGVKEREAAKVLSQGVSLFDPVLSEIICRWFTPYSGAKIFDCFAGDTQKGLVFGQCGFDFTGIELRQEQVAINNRVIEGRNLSIRYICDDGQNVGRHIKTNSMDLLFSCPPYYDLEKYSDLENDASNQGTYEEFLTILTNAFKSALGCLKENRFAVIVVGDVRDKKTGCYYNFVDDVKRIFKESGAALYNELILIETGASTALRAARYMESRKVAKMHQNILVFYKGNTKEIKNNFPKIEFSQDELSQFESEINNETENTEE